MRTHIPDTSRLPQEEPGETSLTPESHQSGEQGGQERSSAPGIMWSQGVWMRRGQRALHMPDSIILVTSNATERMPGTYSSARHEARTDKRAMKLKFEELSSSSAVRATHQPARNPTRLPRGDIDRGAAGAQGAPEVAEPALLRARAAPPRPPPGPAREPQPASPSRRPGPERGVSTYPAGLCAQPRKAERSARPPSPAPGSALRPPGRQLLRPPRRELSRPPRPPGPAPGRRAGLRGVVSRRQVSAASWG